MKNKKITKRKNVLNKKIFIMLIIGAIIYFCMAIREFIQIPNLILSQYLWHGGFFDYLLFGLFLAFVACILIKPRRIYGVVAIGLSLIYILIRLSGLVSVIIRSALHRNYGSIIYNIADEVAFLSRIGCWDDLVCWGDLIIRIIICFIICLYLIKIIKPKVSHQQ